MGGHLKRGENNLFKCKIRPIGKTNNQTKKKNQKTKPNQTNKQNTKKTQTKTKKPKPVTDNLFYQRSQLLATS